MFFLGFGVNFSGGCPIVSVVPVDIGSVGQSKKEKKMDTYSHEATELRLYIVNDFYLWETRRPQFWKNLDRHLLRGNFDREKAVTLLMYLAQEGAQSYCREFGGVVRSVFPKPVREECARVLLEHYVDDLRDAEAELAVQS